MKHSSINLLNINYYVAAVRIKIQSDSANKFIQNRKSINLRNVLIKSDFTRVFAIQICQTFRLYLISVNNRQHNARRNGIHSNYLGNDADYRRKLSIFKPQIAMFKFLYLLVKLLATYRIFVYFQKKSLIQTVGTVVPCQKFSIQKKNDAKIFSIMLWFGQIT